ncbi:MAG TPA: glycoside hydrolase family 2 TIM barrel-domain containing protein [Pyrinomonadaceae bacterium]|nr:glycoside hydrolase family 2 TIM barrel-domain containing protein [Pyrinomonadaceae bacterium]
MKSILQRNVASLIVLSVCLALSATLIRRMANAATAPATTRVIKSFDSDWRFQRGELDGADKIEFDDSAWRKLDVPHDWSIEGPFDKDNPTRGSGGFLPAGIGWYRKHFTLPTNDANRRVFIEFDGVMANSDVWINGFHLGRRPYGYVSFSYELTGHLNFENKPNVLTVRADTSGQPASRWYSGAGIYRHVRLVITGPVHVLQWGTFVTTPKINDQEASVHVGSAIINQDNKPHVFSIQTRIIAPTGEFFARSETPNRKIEPGESLNIERDLTVRNPRRWDLAHPYMYQLVTTVRETSPDQGISVDEETTPFGIREFKFDADTGFWLNGQNFKLKGVCIHHDGGAFGAAVPLRVWERRLEILRELGVNAIRTAHNPPSPEFLDLCDRMGFIVMDEMFDCWTVAKNPHDYHLYFKDWSIIDTRDTVRRDRNHPSIVVYSAGNEIHDTPKPEIAKPILASLVAAFHAEDPSRPVTQALFRPNVSHDYDNGLADLLDVVGQNYREDEILAAHKQKPARKILGTENRHDRPVWLALRDNRPYAGQFLWTGIDYLGEAPAWPIVGHGSGLIDRTGRIRPLGFQRQSWWSNKPMVFITRRVAPTALSPTDPGYQPDPQRRQQQVLFPDWTPNSIGSHNENVEIYSNCETVELFLNGKSLGSKPRPADDSPRNWNVPFTAGTIKAVASNGGRIVATQELRTAGAPAGIILSADRSRITNDPEDLSHVTVTVVDANGVLVPSANNLISFKVTGPGVVAAVDNGDNASHELFQHNERHAFQGTCIAMIKANANAGRITLIASSPGLRDSSITIQVAR